MYRYKYSSTVGYPEISLHGTVVSQVSYEGADLVFKVQRFTLLSEHPQNQTEQLVYTGVAELRFLDAGPYALSVYRDDTYRHLPKISFCLDGYMKEEDFMQRVNAGKWGVELFGEYYTSNKYRTSIDALFIGHVRTGKASVRVELRMEVKGYQGIQYSWDEAPSCPAGSTVPCC